MDDLLQKIEKLEAETKFPSVLNELKNLRLECDERRTGLLRKTLPAEAAYEIQKKLEDIAAFIQATDTLWHDIQDKINQLSSLENSCTENEQLEKALSLHQRQEIQRLQRLPKSVKRKSKHLDRQMTATFERVDSFIRLRELLKLLESMEEQFVTHAHDSRHDLVDFKMDVMGRLSAENGIDDSFQYLEEWDQVLGNYQDEHKRLMNKTRLGSSGYAKLIQYWLKQLTHPKFVKGSLDKEQLVALDKYVVKLYNEQFDITEAEQVRERCITLAAQQRQFAHRFFERRLRLVDAVVTMPTSIRLEFQGLCNEQETISEPKAYESWMETFLTWQHNWDVKASNLRPQIRDHIEQQVSEILIQLDSSSDNLMLSRAHVEEIERLQLSLQGVNNPVEKEESFYEALVRLDDLNKRFVDLQAQIHEEKRAHEDRLNESRERLDSIKSAYELIQHAVALPSVDELARSGYDATREAVDQVEREFLLTVHDEANSLQQQIVDIRKLLPDAERSDDVESEFDGNAVQVAQQLVDLRAHRESMEHRLQEHAKQLSQKLHVGMEELAGAYGERREVESRRVQTLEELGDASFASASSDHYGVVDLTSALKRVDALLYEIFGDRIEQQKLLRQLSQDLEDLRAQYDFYLRGVNTMVVRCDKLLEMIEQETGNWTYVKAQLKEASKLYDALLEHCQMNAALEMERAVAYLEDNAMDVDPSLLNQLQDLNPEDEMDPLFRQRVITEFRSA